MLGKQRRSILETPPGHERVLRKETKRHGTYLKKEREGPEWEHLRRSRRQWIEVRGRDREEGKLLARIDVQEQSRDPKERKGERAKHTSAREKNKAHSKN